MNRCGDDEKRKQSHFSTKFFFCVFPLNINEKEAKTAIKKDETEIAKYKPSLYPILLSTRKVTNQILLISSDACSESEISKIKSENNKEMKKISSEIKKYAPSTFKYVLAIQNEYCEYLNNL